MKVKLIYFILLISIMINYTYAGDPSKVGTTSGLQLLIPVGANSIALGGGVLATVDGAEAIYWNPAGMSYGKRSEFMFNTQSYLADIKQNYFAATYHGEGIGTFGFHLQSLDFGDIEETTEDMPEGTGRTYSPVFFVAGFSFSKFLTDRIIMGITGKIISEKIMQTGGTALAIDMGIQYSFNENMRLGVVMKNVGTKLQYEGRNLENQYMMPGSDLGSDNGFFNSLAQSSNLPSLFGFSFAYKYRLSETSSIMGTAAFSNFNDYYDQVNAGIEYSYNDFFFLRGGYKLEADNIDNQLYGMSLGAGMKYTVGNFKLVLDYAYQQLTDYFDAQNIFSIKIGL